MNNLKAINKKIMILLILGLLLFPLVSAVCTVTLDKETYAPTETATAEMVCDNKDEETDAYVLNWTNSTGDQVELDTGTTPKKNIAFYETHFIPSGYSGAINATLQGPQQEGTDGANVTGASASLLIFTNASVGGKWLGLTSSIKAVVKDELGKKISGGSCRYSVWSNDETTMLKSGEFQLFDGAFKSEWILNYESFNEATDYAVLLSCYCGSSGTNAECIGEDGVVVEKSSGTAKVPFTTNTWLTINENPLPTTHVNGTSYSNAALYAGYDTIYYRANITNNYAGSTLRVYHTAYLINNATEESYQKFEEEINIYGVAYGNNTIIVPYKLPNDVETGIYYVKNFFDVYNENILVTQGVVSSATFNITAVVDVLEVNSVYFKDYWGNTVNTSSSFQFSTSMPASNYTDPYTILTEGFLFDVCFNVNNTYDENIYVYMDDLAFINPINTESFNYAPTWKAVISPGVNKILCYQDILPNGGVSTHSDWFAAYTLNVGTYDEIFSCDSGCDFTGISNYFYIAKIEDTVKLKKWITEPTGSAQGVPATFIVTEREEYLSMNNDCNYTHQQNTDWGNTSFLCNPKDGGSQIVLNLSKYPRAGENFKVCFQAHNYFSDEIDLEFFDMYIDDDLGEGVIQFPKVHEGYVPSIQDDGLWFSETPSRIQELGGNLVDGYGIMCSNWIELPENLEGGISWDVQGKVRIDPDIYDLEETIIWNWESDEFPIFGSRLGENFMRLVDLTNLTTNYEGSTATTGDEIDVIFTYDYYGYDEETFIAEYCFEGTDNDDMEGCFERYFNPDIGTGGVVNDTFILPHFETDGNAEVTLTIYSEDGNTKVGFLDPEPSNTFSVTVSDLKINNVALDKSNYYTGESLHVCANVTNSYDRRLVFELEYDVRCSENISNDETLDRSLLAQVSENRGVGGNQTQMQCVDITIPYADHLKYKTSGCYASVALNSDFVTDVTGYQTSKSSSSVNITDFGMYPQYELDPTYPLVRLYPDWRMFDEVVDGIDKNYYRAKVNITKLTEANLDPDSEIGDDDWDLYVLFSEDMACSSNIYNYTVTDSSGTVINNALENKAIQWVDGGGNYDQGCAIGIEDVNFSDTDDDYFIVKVWYEDFEERTTEALESSSTSSSRSADALEGIENKTGIFHLDVACPSSGTIGTDMDCIVTAYVEDSQTVQKEVDFTCYISDGTSQYSSVNFNQMVTRNAVSLTQTFAVPSTFSEGTSYILQCNADYYNLGSRRDSFYDTFTTSGDSTSSTTGGSSTDGSGEEPEDEEGGTSPITGGAIGGGEGILKIGPIELGSSLFVYFTGGIIILGIFILAALALKNRRHAHHAHYGSTNRQPIKRFFESSKSAPVHHVSRNYTKLWNRLFSGILILALVIIIAAGLYYAAGFISNANIEVPTGIFQDSLFRTLFATVFVIGMIIILFKLLNIRGEIRFGEDGNTRKYHEDKHLVKLQHKLDKVALENQIKSEKNKHHYKVVKVKKK